MSPLRCLRRTIENVLWQFCERTWKWCCAPFTMPRQAENITLAILSLKTGGTFNYACTQNVLSILPDILMIIILLFDLIGSIFSICTAPWTHRVRKAWGWVLAVGGYIHSILRRYLPSSLNVSYTLLNFNLFVADFLHTANCYTS